MSASSPFLAVSFDLESIAHDPWFFEPDLALHDAERYSCGR